MVLMKSKFWKKSKKSTHIVWTFNAKRDDREEIIQSCVVDEEGVSYDVVMPRAVKTRRVQSKSTPLRNPKTLGRTAGRQRPPSIAANDKEQETETWDHEEDEAILDWNGPRDSAPVKPAHRERSPRRPAPVSVVSHENFPEKWNRGGILMHHPGQGDCLFHALVQAPGEKKLSQATSCFHGSHHEKQGSSL
jgi:hypothetical protein